jgi:hypothetical protein
MPDLHGGDGLAVLDGTAKVLDEHRNDLTAALSEKIDFALLTDRSGACGSQVISIGCRLEEPVHYARGVGGAVALLIHRGFAVVSQRDPRTLGLLGAKLDPTLGPSPDVVDYHETPGWLRTCPCSPGAVSGSESGSTDACPADYISIQRLKRGFGGLEMTPEEMQKAIIRNLHDKTGKSLEEWFAVLRDSGLSEKRELKEELKKVHGVGHFQAQTIVKFYLLG